MKNSLEGRIPLGFILLLASITAIGPFSIDTNLPALPQMSEVFNVPIHIAQWSISIFLIGFAVGQIIGGPLSDRIGRRPIAFIGLTTLGIMSFAIAVSNSIELVLLFRFLQAIGGGFTTVLTAAIVRDRYDGVQVARALSMIGMIMLAAPLVAPAVGTALLIHWGWTSIFIGLGLYAVVLLIFVSFGLKETKVVDKKVKGSVMRVVNNYKAVIKNKFAFSCILAGSFAFSGMFVFITSSSFVYVEYFKVPLEYFPFFFGANVVFMISANFVNVQLVKRIPPFTLLKYGLAVICTIAICMLILVALDSIDVYGFLGLMILFSSCLGFINGNAVASALHFFKEGSGTANALNGVVEYSMGGIAGLLLGVFGGKGLFNVTLLMFMCVISALLFVSPYLKVKRVEDVIIK